MRLERENVRGEKTGTGGRSLNISKGADRGGGVVYTDRHAWYKPSKKQAEGRNLTGVRGRKAEQELN